MLYWRKEIKRKSFVPVCLFQKHFHKVLVIEVVYFCINDILERRCYFIYNVYPFK